MTKPRNPQEPTRFAAGAVDLGAIKQRAETRQQQNTATAGGNDSTGSPSGAAGAIPAYFTVTETNFETDVVRRSLEAPVVVSVGSARSPESEQLKSAFEDFAVESLGDFIFAYVDADATPAIAQAFRVEGVPTALVLAGGQPLTSFSGAQPREQLKQWVDAIVQQVGTQLPGTTQPVVNPHEDNDKPASETSDPRWQQAQEALEQREFQQAIDTYAAMLVDDPNSAQLIQAQESAKLMPRLELVDSDLTADSEADPDNIDKQLIAADSELAQGRPEKAFDRLIERMKLSAGDDKNRLREHLLELFDLFDAADPRVNEARQKLASALF